MKNTTSIMSERDREDNWIRLWKHNLLTRAKGLDLLSFEEKVDKHDVKSLGKRLLEVCHSSCIA